MREKGRDGALPCWRIAQLRESALDGRHAFHSLHVRTGAKRQTHGCIFLSTPKTPEKDWIT